MLRTAPLQPAGWPRLIAQRTWRAAGLVLGPYAAWHLAGVEHVREFQAGPASGWLERSLALAVAVSMESLGFAALAGLLALLAWPLSRLVFAARPSGGERLGTWWLLAAGMALWAWRGTYFAGEWLPFLAPLELLWLNLLGFAAACLPGLLVASLLSRRWPGRSPACTGFAVGAAWLGGASLALWRLTSVPAGPASLSAQLQFWGALLLALLLALMAEAYGPREKEPQPRGRSRRTGLVRVLDATLLMLAALALFAVVREGLRDPSEPLAKPALHAAPLTSGPVDSPPSSDSPAPSVTTQLASAAQPNVIYIVVDTLRADALSCYGYPRKTSPRLDRLASEGALFEDLSASASWTKPTTGTLLTGLYPSRHGALYHGSRLRLPAGERTLAEAFQAAGWHTAAFVTNPNIQAVFEFDRGFDTYFDAPVVDTLPKAALRAAWFGRLLIALTRYQFNWNYANDNAEVNRRVLPWLRENRARRFLLYLHYIDPHSPYSPPPRYRREFAQSHGLVLHNRRKELVGRDLYDGEIAYQDAGLGELFDELQQLSLDQNTLIAVTADHGEEWFEFGSLGHGQSLSQPLVHVPLILRGPGIPAGVRVAQPVETISLPATLLELCGLLEPAARFGDGRSFAPALKTAETEARPLFLENEFGMEHHERDNFVLSGVRQGPLKLVLTEKSLYRSQAGEILPIYELFDLSADPGELRDRFDDPSLRPAREGLMQALETHTRFLAAFGLRDEDPLELSEDLKRQLEALGYAVGS